MGTSGTASGITLSLADGGSGAGSLSAGGAGGTSGVVVAGGRTLSLAELRANTSTGGAGGGAGGTAKGTANRAWLTLETVVALLAAGQNTTLLGELRHGDGWESRGGVVLSSVVVNLVDWHGGVDNVRLDGLLVDDWLDGLVDVVVDVLAGDGWLDGLGLTGLTTDLLVVEAGGLGLQALSDLAVVAVLEGAVLDSAEVVVVLLWADLSVLNWLDRGVVVVLQSELAIAA